MQILLLACLAAGFVFLVNAVTCGFGSRSKRTSIGGLWLATSFSLAAAFLNGGLAFASANIGSSATLWTMVIGSFLLIAGSITMAGVAYFATETADGFH